MIVIPVVTETRTVVYSEAEFDILREAALVAQDLQEDVVFSVENPTDPAAVPVELHDAMLDAADALFNLHTAVKRAVLNAIRTEA